jgi:hypothetical protein
MSEEVSNNPLDDVIVTLEYSVKEINALLNLLGDLPFLKAVGAINSIQTQAGPQVEKARKSLDAVLKTTKGANDESTSAT